MHSTDPFDLTATLDRLDGDRALFRELIGFFFEDNPIVLDQLRASLQEGNLSAIERAAHSLKGLTANVGSGPACLAAGRIEECARHKELAVAASTLGELERELARLVTALKQFQATPDPPTS